MTTFINSYVFVKSKKYIERESERVEMRKKEKVRVESMHLNKLTTFYYSVSQICLGVAKQN